MKHFSRSTFVICSLLFSFSFPSGRSGQASAQSLQEAIKLTESEQFEKASAVYMSLVKNEPSNGDNYFFYGENYFKGEILDSSFKAMELDSAKLLYETGVKKNPGNPLNYVGLGKVLWYTDKFPEAKKQFYDAVQIISPANKSGSFTAKQKSLVYTEIAECYTKAKTKDLPEAMNLLNKALKGDPNNPEIYILLGDAALEQNTGDASQAITYYKKARELDKTSAKAFLRIGQLYNRARNLPEAVKSYDEAIKADPNFAPAYREKAEAFYRGKQYETAITNYKKYLELNSGSLSARVRFASFLFLSKKYNEAIAEILEIQKISPSIPFLYRLLAYSYYETGNYPEGVQSIETFFSKASEKKILASDYEYFGKLMTKTGRDSVAVEKLKLAIAKDSTKIDLLGELGNIYLKTKKYPEAIDAFNKKIKKEKEADADVNDYYQLGRAYYYSSQFEKADTAFLKIATMRPDIPVGFLWRARANAKMDPKSEKFLGKPYYEEYLTKIKPEETEKNKKEVIEATSYLAGYYYFIEKDYAKCKCQWEKVIALDPANENAKKSLADPKISKATCPQQNN